MRVLIYVCFLGFLASCNYTQKVRDGGTAFDVKQYDVAIPMLEREYEKARSRREKGQIAWKIGESHKALNRSDLALRWYNTAYNNSYGVEALGEYAYALKRTGDYEGAMQAFKDLGIEIGSPYEYKRDIQSSRIALGWLAETAVEYAVLPVDFNSGGADYAPARLDENQILFTSDRNTASGEATYNWTGRKYTDLFVADKNGSSAQPFSPDLNSENNEGTAVYFAGRQELYFVRCTGPKKGDADNCKIMVSERTGSGWSNPRPLAFQRDGYNYGQPALSSDGETLYFSADLPNGWGGKDLYYAERRTTGDWDEPQLMGRGINTPRNDMFPSVQGDTLYFASEGHTGMGGLDIFKTYKTTDDVWTPVYNLKPPLNSSADDFGFVLLGRGLKPGVWQTGMLSSNRDGNDDLFRFERSTPPPPPVVEIPVDTPVVYRLVLDVYTLEPIFSEPDNPNSRVLGRRPLSDATIQVTSTDTSFKFTTDAEGLLSFDLKEETDYDFFASRDGYLAATGRFSTRGIGRDRARPVQRFELELELDKVYLNREIVLENIYYDFNDDRIRLDAQPTLNQLARDLQLNPGLRIELGSHTDCRGPDGYNQDLSRRRAESAVRYLIQQGIDSDRLAARGYGETQPAADCLCSRCDEDEHQRNRRTTFKVTGVDVESLNR